MSDAGVGSFGAPVAVTLTGYDGDAMEPFISSDDQVLFFNDSNAGPDTQLHWAMRTGDATFQHEGLLTSADSTSLDGVPSLDDGGDFYFVSTRSYATTASTIYGGQFAAGAVSGIALVPGVSRDMQGVVEFDCEVSRDGAALYYVVGDFGSGAAPQTADLFVADRAAQGFTPRDDASLFAAINTADLEYAPATLRSGLELFFTRASVGAGATPSIWRSTRSTPSAPFDAPTQITQASGFVEGPSISSDGSTLYFHRRDPDGFHIYLIKR